MCLSTPDPFVAPSVVTDQYYQGDDSSDDGNDDDSGGARAGGAGAGEGAGESSDSGGSSSRSGSGSSSSSSSDTGGGKRSRKDRGEGGDDVGGSVGDGGQPAVKQPQYEQYAAPDEGHHKKVNEQEDIDMVSNVADVGHAEDLEERLTTDEEYDYDRDMAHRNQQANHDKRSRYWI
eukprot:COSAG01_NODE_28619_length_656_cov_12.008977_1_plen_175_part_10